MKHRSIYSLLLLALLVLFWVSVFDNVWVAKVQAEQAVGLKLVGTVVTNDPSKNFAVIENQATGNQTAYREGDRVGDVMIKKIQSESVIIGTTMGDQVLSMGLGGSAGTVQSPPQMARLDRKEINSTLPDYMQLLREIRVRPHFEAGQPGGFYVSKIEPGSIFAKMGLENGDVIKAVNGRPIARTLQAVEFYDALKKGATVSLEIKRDENTQELHFTIQ